jgi:hypothetical protein
MQRNPIRRNIRPYTPPIGCPSARPVAPAPAPEPEAEPTPDGLVLWIAGRAYWLTVLEPSPGAAAAVVRLRKSDGECHHCAVTLHGPQCDCGDYTWRQAPAGGRCKHLLALERLAATLAPLAAFAPAAAVELPGDLTWSDLDDSWSIGPTPESLDATPAFGAAREWA